MASSHGTDRISARSNLGDNPRLIRVAPTPPPTSAGENLQPAFRLRDSSMLYVHSKPNGFAKPAKSQISNIIWKVSRERRLRYAR